MNTQLLAHCIQQAHDASARGEFNVAITWCQKALHLAPNLPEAHYNIAIAFHGLGEENKAINALRKTASLAQDNPDALNSIGLLCIELKAFQDAERYLKASIKLAPSFAFPHSNLGKLREKQKHLTEAEACFKKAIELQPDLAQAHSNLCGILNAQKRYDEAEAAARKALTIDPESAEAWSNLAGTLCGLKRYDEAEAAARKALAIDPESAEAWSNLAGTLCGLKRYDEAEAAARKALAIDPESAEAWSNLGLICSDQGNFTQALVCYGKALELDPASSSTHLNRSLLLLKMGDYHEGFVEYEYRWEGVREDRPRPNTSLPQWRGEPVTSSDAILLFSEQGFGDTIQFMRYLPMLKERFQRVAFFCPKPLASLTKANFKDIEIIDSTQDIDQKEFHWHCPLLSLALAFQTTLNSIPPASYLAWPRPSPPQLKLAVGFAWQGSPTYDSDTWRSIPLEIYGPLFQNTAIEWVCLQKDVKPKEVAQLPSGSRKAISEVQDFADTAQIVARLDLVITIDSAIAHLAGAMGKPVWLLNRANSEWRWGWKKETSPWYPSMRIFNQKRMGEWMPVIEEVSAALSDFAHAHQQR